MKDGILNIGNLKIRSSNGLLIISIKRRGMENNDKKPVSRKRRSDQEIYDDLTKQIEQMQARQRRVSARMRKKEREERTKRLINAGAAVEAVMKEITGKEKYPAEGENLERILNMLRSESVLTDDQKRQLHAGEEIESVLQKIKNKDHLILTEKNLDIVKKIIEDNSLNQHYIKVGKAVEEKVHIKDLESWSIYISRYADAIKKCQSGEWTLH